MRKSPLAINIPDGIDMGNVRLHYIVDGDKTAPIGLDAGSG